MILVTPPAAWSTPSSRKPPVLCGSRSPLWLKDLGFRLHPVLQGVAVGSAALFVELIGTPPDFSREFDLCTSFIPGFVLIQNLELFSWDYPPNS